MKYALQDDRATFSILVNNTEAFHAGWRQLEQPTIDLETDFWNRDVVVLLRSKAATFPPEVGKLRVEG
jgi:hypothetical protein